MASSPPAELAVLPNTDYMGDVLFVVRTRACPALPQHVQGAHHVGIRFEAATFVDALENRLPRAVAFIPALTVRQARLVPLGSTGITTPPIFRSCHSIAWQRL